MEISAEEIKENWETFRAFFNEDTLKERTAAADTMLDALEERLAVCPASGRHSFHECYPGGLVKHSLNVLKNVFKINKAYDWKLPVDSMVIGALLHDLGKVGDVEKDYYISQEDNWRRTKLGELYTYNDELPYMSVPERGLFLCQHFGLKLTHDETLAIKLNDGFVLEENKKYCLKAPKLAFAVMTADYIATCDEGSKW